MNNKIFYLLPDSEKPSWGVGMLYNHVLILIQNGFNAHVIKKGDLVAPSWLDIEVPIYDFNFFYSNLSIEDILVVPEVMIDMPNLKSIKCRKFLFIQASAYIYESMPIGETHQSLGFEHVLIIMPHMQIIVEKHLKLPFTLIPPYIPDFFFSTLNSKRERQILLFPKFHQIDYSVIKYIIHRHLKSEKRLWFDRLLTNNRWRIKELKGYTHKEVAKLMNESLFFISINTFEALNTSIVESMASGCIVFCYEGVGPKDYLLNNINAKVFPNNEAYALAESVCNQIDQFDHQELELNVIRQNAYETAKKYTRSKTEERLLDFYQHL